MKDCLTQPMWHTKNAFFREMQFWSHCYTVVSYQALFRLSVYKIPAVYLSGAKNVCFCTIRDFGSPTNTHRIISVEDSSRGQNIMVYIIKLFTKHFVLRIYYKGRYVFNIQLSEYGGSL